MRRGVLCWIPPKRHPVPYRIPLIYLKGTVPPPGRVPPNRVGGIPVPLAWYLRLSSTVPRTYAVPPGMGGGKRDGCTIAGARCKEQTT